MSAHLDLRAVVLPIAAAACAAQPSLPPGLRAREPQAVMTALLGVEKTRNATAAPFLLYLVEREDADLAVRAEAAAVLLALGFPEGRDFCLALLKCGLEPDPGYRIPQTDAPAFPREIAHRALARWLEEAGRTPPRYDPNFGVPDLRRAWKAYVDLLGKTPFPGPDAALVAAIPRTPPPGYEDLPWQELRNRLCSGLPGSE